MMSSLIGICTVLTIIICYVKKIHFLNWDDNSMNVHYYAKSYLRGNIYYFGGLFYYLTMRGPRRKKLEIEEPLLNEEEQAKKEREEKEKKARRKRKRIKAAKRMGNIALIAGLICMTLDTMALHYVFQWGRKSKKIAGQFAHVMYITFGKAVFVASFMAILMPIAAKYKAFGNFIAQNRLLQLIGNISFGGYLYHFTVIMLRLNSQVTMPTYKFYDLFGAWSSDIAYTLVLATLSTLLVELPVQNMWRNKLEKPLVVKLKAYVNGPKRIEEEKEEVDASKDTSESGVNSEEVNPQAKVTA